MLASLSIKSLAGIGGFRLPRNMTMEKIFPFNKRLLHLDQSVFKSVYSLLTTRSDGWLTAGTFILMRFS